MNFRPKLSAILVFGVAWILGLIGVVNPVFAESKEISEDNYNLLLNADWSEQDSRGLAPNWRFIGQGSNVVQVHRRSADDFAFLEISPVRGPAGALQKVQVEYGFRYEIKG